MPDTEVPNLTAAGALDGTELVHVVQSGNSRRTTTLDVASLASAATTVDVVSNVTSGTLLGRTASGSGDSEELDQAAVLTFLGVEAGATADQTASEIATAYNSQVAQVSGGEITAGTETALRTYAPADIVAFVAAHGGGGGGDTAVEDDDTQILAAATTLNFTGTGVTVTDAGSGQANITIPGPATPPTRIVSATAYTAALADANGIINGNNASEIAITIPPESSVAFDVGTNIILTQIGAGKCTFGGDTGVTVNVEANFNASTAAQFGSIVATKYGSDLWVVQGRLEASA
ncbi:MAG: hypothetical protein AAF545_15035 [Pseudomonadota bacterium]